MRTVQFSVKWFDHTSGDLSCVPLPQDICLGRYDLPLHRTYIPNHLFRLFLQHLLVISVDMWYNMFVICFSSLLNYITKKSSCLPFWRDCCFFFCIVLRGVFLQPLCQLYRGRKPSGDKQLTIKSAKYSDTKNSVVYYNCRNLITSLRYRLHCPIPLSPTYSFLALILFFISLLLHCFSSLYTCYTACLTRSSANLIGY